MKFLKLISEKIDAVNEKLGIAASWLTLILVLVVSYDVVVRYLFQNSSVAMQELEWHIFAIIFLLAAGYTLKIDEHVRVDVFYTRYSDRTKAWINLIGSIVLLITFCVVAILSAKDFVLVSFKFKETSPDAGGLPARYILKAIIPVSFFFLLLQGISLAIKSYFKIKTPQSINKMKS